MRLLINGTAAVIIAFCPGVSLAQSPPAGAAGWVVLATTDPEGVPPPFYCVAFIVPAAEASVTQMPWGPNFRAVVARYGPYDSMESANAALVREGWAASEGRVAVSPRRC